MAGLLVAALASVSIFEDFDPGGGIEPEGDFTAEPRVQPPRASGSLEPGPVSMSIADAILGEGIFTAIDAGGPGVEPVWRIWAPGSSRPLTIPLPLRSERLALDPSGQAVAFTLPSDPSGRSLWVRFADGRGTKVADDVLTFAWKTADPGRIAWSSPAPEGIRLSTARVAGPASSAVLDAQVVADVAPGVVVGWTSLGVWVERFDEAGGERTFAAYAISGQRSGIRRADVVAFHPAGDRHFVASAVGDDWLLLTADRGDVIERIPWSPQDTELTAAAWSDGEPGRIAVGGFDRGSLAWVVMVWDPIAGQVSHRVDLPYRVLGLGWTPNGRLLLVSVSDDRGRSAVLAYDLGSMADHRVVFDELAGAAVVPVPGAVVAVPEVTGLTVGRAIAELEDLGLTTEVVGLGDGIGLTVTQDPAPGTEVAAGTIVTIHGAVPVADGALTALAADQLGTAACDPASPVAPAMPVGDGSLTEIRGVGAFELWGQLLTPLPLRTDRPVKMLMRIDVEGRPVIQAREPVFLARHPARRVVYARWGPFLHEDHASGYDRPGHEWSAAFTFREPGCWTIRVVVGFDVADFYVRVW